MNLVYIHWRGQRTGPHTIGDVRRMIETKRLSALHRLEMNSETISVREFLERERLEEEAQKLSTPHHGLSTSLADSTQASEDTPADDRFLNSPKLGIFAQISYDLIVLKPYLLSPLTSFFNFAWFKDFRVLILLLVGLPPGIFLYLFSNDIIDSSPLILFWTVSAYMSFLWSGLFWRLFRVEEVSVLRCIITYIITIAISMPLLFAVFPLIPGMNEIYQEIFSPHFDQNSYLIRFSLFWIGVGVPEEMCKVFVLFIIAFFARQHSSPRACMFLGMISGLAFGMSEGVGYQMGLNLEVANGDPAVYHILNWLRLTTLPFLHAIWAGIAGYFIGLSWQVRRLSLGLFLAAILIPSLFHALHNTGGIISIFTDCLSVTGLLAYLTHANKHKLEPTSTLPERNL